MKEADKEKLSESQERLAARLAKGIVDRQRSIADWLNHKTKGFTARRWMWLLVIFCIGVGSYCLRLLIEAFN